MSTDSPKYDCATHPSTTIDPGRPSPLDTNCLYLLSVYDQKRVPADEFCFGPYDPAGWATVGVAHFSANDQSFHLTDHKIKKSDWNVGLHSLSWSDAHEGTARTPVGCLQFSDDLGSFLGTVMTSDGGKRTVQGVIIAGYHTKRAKASGGMAFDSYDFFFGAVRSTGGTPELEPLCQFWDPDSYDDEDDHGFMYDVSPDAHWVREMAGRFVKPPGVGECAFVSFDIAFEPDLKSFEGTFSNDNEVTEYNWTGTAFKIPKKTRKLIEDRVKSESIVVPLDAEKAFYKAQNSAPASYAVDVYLPAAMPDTPPPYASMAAYSSGEPMGMSELKLWQISSYRYAKNPDTGDLDAKDVVQEYVGGASHNMFMSSLPSSAKDKFHFSDSAFPLQDKEKDIKHDYAKFNDAASIPYLAQALQESVVSTNKQKEEIDGDKIKAWFTAMSSLKPPGDGKPDPVERAGLKRDNNLKEFQDAYSAQMDDLYKFYYKIKVADFAEYCSNQRTAKTWFDKLKAYVESDPFVAQWVSLNSDINYKESSRSIMEASVKFNILEDIGYPKVAVKDRQTPDIIKTLASSAAMASFSTSVKYDPTLEKSLADLINDVGTSTEEVIKAKYGNMIGAWRELQALMQAYGSTKAFGDWVLKIMRHYGEGGKGGFLSLLQMAGDQIKGIWKKLADGKSRKDIVAEFSEAVVELAEGSMKDPKRWKKFSEACNKFKGGIKAILANLALAASAAALIAVAAGQWGAVDPAMRVYLGLEAFTYAMRGLKLFASTTLGKFIKTKVLDNKQFLERLGEWFTKKGVPKDIPGGSILGKLVGKDVGVFLKRLGAVLAVAMVVVCAFDFKNALETGDSLDIIESSIFLVLAIIDVAVVGTGMVASVLGASSVAACAGPIGLAFAAVGFIVAMVFFIIRLVDPKPPPDPVQDFIDDEVQEGGWKKK